MRLKKPHPLSLYLFITITIASWWILAFNGEPKSHFLSVNNQKNIKISQNSPYSSLMQTLSPMKRETVHTALSGDISLMVKLIAEWDLDAQIMESHGVRHVKRLPSELFIRSQILGRQFRFCSQEELETLRERQRRQKIKDDNDTLISLSDKPSNFLPQTYVSASFLMALLSPEYITAIPQGLRKLSHIYPTAITNKIPLDIDRYNSEKLYQTHPQAAFIADYSHPSTIQALKNQGIQLFTLKNIHTISHVVNALERIGHVINRAPEAELLKIFIESSMLSIDNRLQALHLALENEQRPIGVLFLNYHNRYSVPMPKTFTGQLLQRAGKHELINPLFPSIDAAWSLQIDQEQIANLNPDCLIIGTSNRQLLQNNHSTNECNLFYVDATVQESPTQYLVLAYYDIFQALSTLCTP